jgi:DUF971 family protein
VIDEDPQFWPSDVFADRPAGRLEVTWSDGHRSVYEFEYLRWRCPCAACQGEMGVPGALAKVTELRPDQTQMAEMRAVGRYAIQPLWQDGHDTGLYDLRLLRRMCPCDECRARFTPSPARPTPLG